MNGRLFLRVVFRIGLVSLIAAAAIPSNALAGVPRVVVAEDFGRTAY